MRIALFDPIGRVPPASDALARERLIGRLNVLGHDLALFGLDATERTPPPIGRSLHGTAVFALVERFQAVHEQTPFDAAHVLNCDGLNVAFMLANRFPDLPLVISIRGPSIEASLCLGHRGWRRLASLGRSTFLVPSFELFDRLADRLGRADRIAVVPNGIPRPFPALIPAGPLRDRLGVGHGDQLWVIPGAVRREDRMIQLLESLDSSGQVVPDLLVIAGAAVDEDRHRRLETFLASRRFPCRTLLLGGLTRETILSLSAASDLCLYPPRQEGGRSSLLEAALLGTPVVASASPSHLALAALPWVRLLVDPDADALARAAAESVPARETMPQISTDHLFTTAAEADAILSLYRNSPDSARGRPLGQLTDEAERTASIGEASSSPVGPILVLARGSGTASKDLAWAEDALVNARRVGLSLRILLGTDVSPGIGVANLIRSDEAILPLPDSWLAAASREAVVIAEEVARATPCRSIIGFGLDRAGLVAALVGTRLDLASLLILDDLDAQHLQAEFTSADALSLRLASALLVVACQLPIDLGEFGHPIRGKQVRGAVAVTSTHAVGTWHARGPSPWSRFPTLPMPPRRTD